MAAAARLSIEDACTLLGLASGSRRNKAMIEQAYAQQLRHWSTVRNCALKFEDRERAEDVIALLQEAKNVCLSNQASGATARPPLARPKPPYAPRPARSGRQAPQPTRTFWKRARKFIAGVLAFVKGVVAVVRACGTAAVFPYRIIARINDRTTRHAAAAVWTAVLLLLANRIHWCVVAVHTSVKNAMMTSRFQAAPVPQRLATDSAQAALLVRTWPASKVTVNGNTVVDAPARSPIRIQAGQTRLRLVALNSSLKPWDLTVDVPPGRLIELRVDLEKRHARILDRGAQERRQ